MIHLLPVQENFPTIGGLEKMLEVNFCVKSETHAIYLLLSYRGHFRAAVVILVKKLPNLF